MRILLSAGALLASSPALAQTTWWVDASACPGPGDGSKLSPFCTIAQATGAATDGDTILVLPGTYGRFNYVGKDLTVRSDADGAEGTVDPDASVTIVDGGGVGPVVDLTGSGPSVLEGFTLLDGSTSTEGGGVRCIFADVTIRGNVIRNCTAGSTGGGISIASSTFSVEDNRIEGCSGGARGGALHIQFGPVGTIRGNEFVGNQATRGGGLYLWSNGTPVEENRFVENTAFDGGGGLWLEGAPSSIAVRRNVFAGNIETKYGGAGLFINGGAHPSVVNNLFVENRTSGTFGFGGAVLVNSGGTTASVFRHNTIVGNDAKVGGAFLLSSGSKVEFHDGILWDNDDPTGCAISLQGPCEFRVFESDVEGGTGSVCFSGSPLGIAPFTDTIDADPLFVDRDGSDGSAATWEDNDYHLRLDSPCVDAVASVDSVDFEGDPRPTDGSETADMGADEWAVHLYHVGVATPGGTLTLGVTGAPGDVAYVYASFSALETPVAIPPFGGLLIAFPLILVWVVPPIGPEGSATLDVVLPASSTVGLELYLQALVGTRLSNLDVVVIE